MHHAAVQMVKTVTEETNKDARGEVNILPDACGLYRARD
jgi:hypothetical protein